jgi:hypothetical protein
MAERRDDTGHNTIVLVTSHGGNVQYWAILQIQGLVTTVYPAIWSLEYFWNEEG